MELVEGLNDGGASEGNFGFLRGRESQCPCEHREQLFWHHAELVEGWAFRKSPHPVDFGEGGPVDGREPLNHPLFYLLGIISIWINIFGLLDEFGLGLGLEFFFFFLLNIDF
ncbi:MAG: hypothetical protein IPI97_14930 [Nitrosomonas sp.]|nr:hypothetical protein [Nitrosomonas sp.]